MVVYSPLCFLGVTLSASLVVSELCRGVVEHQKCLVSGWSECRRRGGPAVWSLVYPWVLCVCVQCRKTLNLWSSVSWSFGESCQGFCVLTGREDFILGRSGHVADGCLETPSVEVAWLVEC